MLLLASATPSKVGLVPKLAFCRSVTAALAAATALISETPGTRPGRVPAEMLVSAVLTEAVVPSTLAITEAAAAALKLVPTVSIQAPSKLKRPFLKDLKTFKMSFKRFSYRCPTCRPKNQTQSTVRNEQILSITI